MTPCMEKCPKFIQCSAPLCPLDEDLDAQTWFPDEPICAREGMLTNYPWLQTQKKIAKKARNQDRYFTGKMVQRNCVIYPGIIGLDPNRDEKPQLDRWFRIHPEKKKKRELTKEQKLIFRERMKKGKVLSEVRPE